MLKPFLIVFGVIVLAGGIQGYLKGSVASIMAGSIFGILLIAGAFLSSSKPPVGLTLGLLASAALAYRFGKVFFLAPDKGAVIWPAGVLTVLSIIGLVLIGMAFAKK